jgi:nitric oxide dioxygenase
MVSNHLHQRLAEGDVIEVAPPAGDFFLHEERDTPVVLISAGVGITPMMAMLEHLHAQRSRRPVRFFHAARHAGAQAFAPRVRQLVQGLPDGAAWIVHEEAIDGVTDTGHDALGRLDLSDQALPSNADHYVCGPRGFMAAQIEALRARGVPQERIHAEAFGTGGVAA